MGVDMAGVAALCEEIALPAAVTGRVLAVLGAGRPGLEELVLRLTDPRRAAEAGDQLARELAGQDPEGMEALAVYLAAAAAAWERVYRPLGIGRAVYLHTMTYFTVTVNDYHAHTGAYVFEWAGWPWRHTGGLIYRLGTLEFEMLRLEKACGGLAAGAPLLSVHIPADAALRPEALTASYRRAPAFFDRYFPAFGAQRFFCDSWLLSPVLKELLPTESGILLFQGDYRLEVVRPEGEWGMYWVFGPGWRETDLEDLPEDSRLRRGAKALLLAGRRLGEAAGSFPAAKYAGGD